MTEQIVNPRYCLPVGCRWDIDHDVIHTVFASSTIEFSMVHRRYIDKRNYGLNSTSTGFGIEGRTCVIRRGSIRNSVSTSGSIIGSLC